MHTNTYTYTTHTHINHAHTNILHIDTPFHQSYTNSHSVTHNSDEILSILELSTQLVFRRISYYTFQLKKEFVK